MNQQKQQERILPNEQRSRYYNDSQEFSLGELDCGHISQPGLLRKAFFYGPGISCSNNFSEQKNIRLKELS